MEKVSDEQYHADKRTENFLIMWYRSPHNHVGPGISEPSK
jgi:hypothetical protein